MANEYCENNVPCNNSDKKDTNNKPYPKQTETKIITGLQSSTLDS